MSSGPPPCGGRCRAVLQPSDTIRWATADLASGARPSAAVRVHPRLLPFGGADARFGHRLEIPGGKKNERAMIISGKRKRCAGGSLENGAPGNRVAGWLRPA